MNPFIIIVLSFCGLAFIIWVFYLGWKEGVREGRKETASGYIKMHLVEFIDGTREWHSEKELEKLSKHTIVK